MRSKFLSSLFIFLFSSVGFAIEVKVDSFVSDALRAFGFGRGLPFAESFQCGKKSNFKWSTKFCDLKCTDAYCEESCSYPEAKEDMIYNLTVENCSADEISIFGSNGYSAKVTRSEYESSHNNWFISFLKSVGKFIQPIDSIYVDMASPIYLSRMREGKPQPLRAFAIRGHMQSGTAKNKTRFTLYVTNELAGLEQILFFGLTPEDDQYFLKIEGLKWQPGL